jgi:hypothetical protein
MITSHIQGGSAYEFSIQQFGADSTYEASKYVRLIFEAPLVREFGTFREDEIVEEFGNRVPSFHQGFI